MRVFSVWEAEPSISQEVAARLLVSVAAEAPDAADDETAWRQREKKYN